MIQQFKSMDELLTYLGTLEERIKSLETENGKLLAIANRIEDVNEDAIERAVLYRLPKTQLLDPSFWKRAFAVWGHFFVANFVISMVFLVLYLCLMVVVFGFTFANLVPTQ